MKANLRKTGVLYETEIKFVLEAIDAAKNKIKLDSILKNGRGSYLIFQDVAAYYAGLTGGTEGSGSDLVEEESGNGYEVKSYHDHVVFPESRYDEVHCGPSSVFANNSSASKYKKLIQEEDYKSALELCFEKGYGKNDFYVFTNTSKFKNGFFRYLVIHRDDLIKIVEKEDPAKVSRKKLLGTTNGKTFSIS
jgi:hypothetical protein